MFTEIIKPRFLETDALGHINNNTYGIWFEAARDDFFRIFNPSLDPKKWNLIMAHSSFDFLKEVFYQEEVIVMTAVKKIGNSSVELTHAVYQDEKLCTIGKGIFIYYDHNSKKSIRIPENIRMELEKHIFIKEHWPAFIEELNK